MPGAFDAALQLKAARRGAGLTQSRLAELGSTSQATLSAYEAGRKQPSVATLARLLAATGVRLQVAGPPRPRTDEQLVRAGELLPRVIALAEELPFTRRAPLRYPRLASGGAG